MGHVTVRLQEVATIAKDIIGDMPSQVIEQCSGRERIQGDEASYDITQVWLCTFPGTCEIMRGLPRTVKAKRADMSPCQTFDAPAFIAESGKLTEDLGTDLSSTLTSVLGTGHLEAPRPLRPSLGLETSSKKGRPKSSRKESNDSNASKSDARSQVFR